MSADARATPAVSVGLPVYNGEKHLDEAIRSVLSQTFDDLELVISDNASSDSTPAICERWAEQDPRVRYVRQERNAGSAGNFNRTLELARGRWFKWMAHDDIIAPAYLERCVDVFRSSGDEVVLVFPRRRLIRPDGTPVDGEPHLVGPKGSGSFDRVSFARLVRTCSSRCPMFVFGLMPTELARRTRGMGAFPAADLIFVAELRLRGEFREVPEPLYTQRLHEASPDVRDRMTKRGDAAWFDPALRRRPPLPEARLLVEYLRAIRHARPSFGRRIVCTLALWGHVWIRLLGGLRRLRRRVRRVLWSLWSQASIGAARASRWTSLPLRTWMLGRALRRFDGRMARRAVSGPWWRPNPHVVGFAARRLAPRARRHRRAWRLLEDWRDGGREPWAAAAAEALAAADASPREPAVRTASPARDPAGS